MSSDWRDRAISIPTGDTSQSDWRSRAISIPTSPPDTRSIASKIWDAAKWPEEKSAEGLQMISEGLKPNPEITGNLPRDIVMNYPSLSANVLSKVAPGFVSRGALATAGASKALQTAMPLVSAVGEGIGKQVESVSGALPGSLKYAFQNPGVMLSRGKAAAGPLYDAAKAEMAPAESLFKGMYKPQEIVDSAQQYLGKGGQLQPPEALMYRKALDKLMGSKNVVIDELIPMRREADAMAKASENIAQADPMYQRGRYAESLRNLIPQNKGGGASTFKLGIMTALENMGIPGKLGLALMSPAIAGVGSSLAGAVEPIATNPRAMTAIQQLIQTLGSRNQ